MGKEMEKEKEYNWYERYLMFEGEYLNGKRNGKGKEYCLNKLIFEGEYLKGRKWKGKGFNEDGNVIYEINYSNDGKTKEYVNDYHGNVTFEGEYLKGERNGKGKEYNFFGKLIFEGEYLNGKRNGRGKEYNFFGKLKFEGLYFNGKKWEGKGYDYNNNIVYELKD